MATNHVAHVRIRHAHCIKGLGRASSTGQTTHARLSASRFVFIS